MDCSLLFLGTGSSVGVPVIGCHCPVCTGQNPYNQRTRSSALLSCGEHRLLIDAGPDVRSQLLRHKVDSIDGLFLTHTHFDHVAGLDELRVLTDKRQAPLPCLLSQESFNSLQYRYHYLFNEKGEQENSKVKIEWQPYETTRGSRSFAGFELTLFAYEQQGMRVDGLRVGDLAYLTDIKIYPGTLLDDLKGVKRLVVGAVRPHYSRVHFTFEEAIAFAECVGAERTYFTHIGHEVDHCEAEKSLPATICLSYDGLKI